MSGKVAALGLGLLALFIGASFYFSLTGGPSRTQAARLDPYGDIRVHLETQPDPPKTGGIPLIVHITDPNGKYLQVDQVQYDYKFQDGPVATLQGASQGEGTFSAVAELTDVGEWQVRVTLVKGNQQTQVKFTLPVGANI